jgi:hypothetical protein
MHEAPAVTGMRNLKLRSELRRHVDQLRTAGLWFRFVTREPVGIADSHFDETNPIAGSRSKQKCPFLWQKPAL